MPTIVDKFGHVDYFGRLSWGNFVDWLVTLCLGTIIGLTTVLLGGVRPDTHAILLPLFLVLLALHGLWMAVDDESPKRLSQIPFLFVPFLGWMVVNTLWISPSAWRGWHEIIYALEIFVFVWVACNNVRTRAHLWVLIVMALAPAAYAVFIGYYQFFQNPAKIASAATEFGVRLSPEFAGQATGSFADPSSFAVFLVVLLPSLIIAGLVPRLPVIIRLLCLYIALMFLAGIVFAQEFWSLFLVVPILIAVPWFCFEKKLRRLKYSVLGIGLFVIVAVPLAVFFPRFQRGFQNAAVAQSVQLALWDEASMLALDHPVSGGGGGSFPLMFEQSDRVSLPNLPATPHNDYLLILSQYGLLGFSLFILPILYVVIRGYREWRREPFAARLINKKGTIMPPRKFFLSLGLSGVFVFGLCLFCTFVFYVPALALYGALFFVILVKSTFNRSVEIPEHWLLRLGYCAVGALSGFTLYSFSAPRLEAQGLEIYARQRLDQIVTQRIHVSGNPLLLDGVIEQFEEVLRLDPDNVDAWIGLSAARCQIFFRQPAGFLQIGEAAADAAREAIRLSDGYWLAWAQLGIAESLAGNLEAAEKALKTAVDLAPNNSNAHYYWASYLSEFPEQRAAAVAAVERALAINPENAAARRLQQKLLIL